MTNTVLIKRSGTANAVPTAGNLVAGELALNYTDGNLFYKNAGNVVTVIASNQFSSVTGNITGGNILTGGLVSATSTITSAANVTGGNLITGGIISATGNIISANNIIASKVVTANDNIVINSTGVEGGQLVLAWANVNGLVAQGNSTWNLDTDAGNSFRLFYQNGAAATSVLISASPSTNVVSFPSSAGVSATGNITGSNLLTSGQISATGTITSNGATNSTAFAVGNSAVSNVGLGFFPTAGTPGEYAIRDYSTVTNSIYLDVGMGGTANGSFQFRTTNSFRTLATITSTGVNTPYAVSATGNITGSYFIGNGSQLTGVVASAGASIVNGTSNVVVAASGNVTVGVAGTATVATFTTAGIIANSIAATNNGAGTNFKVGDDTWLGDINLSDTLSIRGQQNAANAYIVFGNADSTALGRAGSGPLTYGGAFSATGNVTGGNLLTAGLISSTGTITGTSHLGSVVSVTANVTGGNLLTGGLISATSTVTGSTLIGSVVTASGNITGSNILTGGLISATGNITGGNVNATSLTGTSISVSGNIAGGNLAAVTNIFSFGTVVGTGNVSGGNLLTAGLVSATGTITSAANITGGNLLTAGLASVTGNVIAGNVNTSTVRPTSGALTLSTASGAINLNPAGNIVLSANTYINNLNSPVQDGDAATKQYVDNFAAQGITYHQPVSAATTTTLATTTGGTISYAQPNGASNGVGAYLSTTGSFNLIDTVNVQTAGTRILVKNEGNAVYNGIYTWSNATAIVRSTDADEYGSNSSEQLSLNDYFFVSNGNVNVGSAYVVNAPTGTITFGTSNITFAQFSSSQVYTANTSAGLSLTGTVFSAKVDNITTAFDGTGNIIVKASAALTTPNIGAATGTSLNVTANVDAGNLRTGGLVTATGNITGGNLLTAGLISSTGTITGSSHLGAVVSVTGNVTGGNVLNNGLISSTGNSTAANYLTSGLVSATGNVTGGNLLTAGILTATGNVVSVANVIGGNITTTGVVTATGNITGGNILTAGIISATGNITGGNANITGTTAATSKTTGALVVGGGVGVASDVWAGNSVTVDGGVYGNVVATQFAGLFATAAGANPYSIVQVRSNDGTTGIGMQAYANLNGLVYSNTGITFQTGATIRDKDYPTSGTTRVTIDSTGLVANGIVSANGNVTGGNLLTVGQISATGNITGNFYIGNGAFLTGLSAGTADQIANGATSIAIPVSSGNIAMSVAGQSNTVVINLGSLTMYGTFAGPKTLSANVAVADAVNALLLGPVTLGNGYNITVPDSSTLYVFAP